MAASAKLLFGLLLILTGLVTTACDRSNNEQSVNPKRSFTDADSDDLKVEEDDVDDQEFEEQLQEDESDNDTYESDEKQSGDSVFSPLDDEDSITSANVADGAKLYKVHCSSCHGSLAKSTKLNASVKRIKSGFKNKKMASLKDKLTEDDLKSIALTLATKPASNEPVKPKSNDLDIAEGKKLYNIHCAGCHNSFEKSTKAGATFEEIVRGIEGQSQMRILKGKLTDTQNQEIADALASLNQNTKDIGARKAYGEWDYNQGEIEEWIRKASANAPATKKFVYLPKAIYEHKKNRNMARVCLSKSINSVSQFNADIIHPVDVSDDKGVVFSIDMKDYFTGLWEYRTNRQSTRSKPAPTKADLQPEAIWNKYLTRPTPKNTPANSFWNVSFCGHVLRKKGTRTTAPKKNQAMV